jgi:hypothetical protein
MKNTVTVTDEPGMILVERDQKHRIYLCEYGLVHLVWGRNSLVYCPGDLIGLSYMLLSIAQPCGMECTRGECCRLSHGEDQVYLPYGSVQIPFTVAECRELHFAAQEAVEQLHRLKGEGYFSNQTWLPQPAGEVAH